MSIGLLNPFFVIGVITVIANIIFETSKQYFAILSFSDQGEKRIKKRIALAKSNKF